MYGLRICSFLLSFGATILLFIALTSKHWISTHNYHYGLWTICWKKTACYQYGKTEKDCHDDLIIKALRGSRQENLTENYLFKPLLPCKAEAIVMQVLVGTATLLSNISFISCLLSCYIPKIGHVSVQKMTSVPTLLAGCCSFIAAVLFRIITINEIIYDFPFDECLFSVGTEITWLAAILLFLSGILCLRNVPASELYSDV